MPKDSYGFIGVIAKKGSVTLEKYQNVLYPHDVIYCIKKDGKFDISFERYIVALDYYTWELQKNA